uniref:RRM domain-containing protein n=1 Tax=Ciona savignyi TaxID=51511 RepID=H2YAT1_CIOSA
EVDEAVEEQQDERKVVTTFRPSNTTEAKISPPQEVTEEVNPPHTAVEPPKQASSCVLHISNLVRPFAISQLKQLLSEHGQFDESSFWINNIKSHCFATYESKEVAE